MTSIPREVRECMALIVTGFNGDRQHDGMHLLSVEAAATDHSDAATFTHAVALLRKEYLRRSTISARESAG